MIMYLTLCGLALVACSYGWLLEVAESNLIHLQNDRPPNASAALFPAIPFVPLLYVGGAWVMITFIGDAGIGLVVAYALVRIGLLRIKYRKARAALDEALKSHNLDKQGEPVA